MSDHAPQPVTDRGRILAVLERDRAARPYGIADVDQLWEVSRWWRDGTAVVGLLDLPAADVPVVYAVAAGEEQLTLALLSTLDAHLPDRFVITGPRGLSAHLERTRRPLWDLDAHKMALRRPDRLPAADAEVVPLGVDDIPALERLFATDDTAGSFFHPGLLDSTAYCGIWNDGELAACAGIHIVDIPTGVAAIGNVVTHPAHRRRGLGRRVVGAVCAHLACQVDVMGLNVESTKTGALALYRGLGFEIVVDYSEAELDRRRAPHPPEEQPA